MSELPTTRVGSSFLVELFNFYVDRGVEAEFHVRRPDGSEELVRFPASCRSESRDIPVTDPATGAEVLARDFKYRCVVTDSSSDAYTVVSVTVRLSVSPYTIMFFAPGVNVSKDAGYPVEFTFIFGFIVPLVRLWG